MDSRISARAGQIVKLDTVFYSGGEVYDPYAIREINIYRDQVQAENLVASIPIANPEPDDDAYPDPIVQTDTGKYYMPFLVPADAVVPAVYLDVWTYFPTNPCGGTGGTGGTNPCDLDSAEFTGLLLSCCHRFWAYPDNLHCADNLLSFQLAFEPLNQKFGTTDKRYLEVGFMPMPLYDFDYNFFAPFLPSLKATISIYTRNEELLVDCDDMITGLRQGHYRTNPFVFKWLLNGSQFLIGTYKYRIAVQFPDGTVQNSSYFNFTIF